MGESARDRCSGLVCGDLRLLRVQGRLRVCASRPANLGAGRPGAIHPGIRPCMCIPEHRMRGRQEQLLARLRILLRHSFCSGRLHARSEAGIRGDEDEDDHVPAHGRRMLRRVLCERRLELERDGVAGPLGCAVHGASGSHWDLAAHFCPCRASASCSDQRASERSPQHLAWRPAACMPMRHASICPRHATRPRCSCCRMLLDRRSHGVAIAGTTPISDHRRRNGGDVRLAVCGVPA